MANETSVGTLVRLLPFPSPFPFSFCHFFILRLGSQSYVQPHSEPFDEIPVPPLEQRTYD